MKVALRQRYLKARLSLGGEGEALGAKAQLALCRHPIFTDARAIMVYLAFRGEIETGRVINAGLEAGKIIAAPVTVRAERRLVPLVLTGDPGELREGAYGISEPDPSQCRPLDPGLLDLVVVPGVAFDARGGRLGYGGGYYDRFLSSEATRARRAALAFEVQVMDDPLPLDAFDIPMDFIFTERRVIQKTGRREDGG